MSEQVNQRVRRDTALALAFVFSFIALALRGQWSELLNEWLHRYEWLDLDELMLGLGVVLIALSWFSWRRWHDLRLQMQATATLQVQRDQLFDHNRLLSQRVLSAQEDERRQLARELHDEIAQVCTAIRYDAAYLSREVTSESARQSVGRIEHSATQMHQLTRDMLNRLRPAHLDSLGFDDALVNLCQQWQTQMTLPCKCLIQVQSTHWSDYLKTSLYRVVQEALTNVARHAHASNVLVRLMQTQDRLVLEVQDDGVGLAVTTKDKRPPQGLGMLGIGERLASVGGQAQWLDATPGTLLRCTLTLSESDLT
jgi:two-component system sensor histidine kinase UhpB